MRSRRSRDDESEPGAPVTRPHRTRFPGIVSDARRLRCSRVHLYLVLTGARTSHRLLARYRTLKRDR